jgi:hypothetical protein
MWFLTILPLNLACVKTVRNCTDIVRLSTILPVSMVGSMAFSHLTLYLFNTNGMVLNREWCLEEKNLPPGKLLIKPKTLK